MALGIKVFPPEIFIKKGKSSYTQSSHYPRPTSYLPMDPSIGPLITHCVCQSVGVVCASNKQIFINACIKINRYTKYKSIKGVTGIQEHKREKGKQNKEEVMIKNAHKLNGLAL